MDYTKAKMDDVIKRINELYKKSKEEGLTESEKEEQKVLRRRYIDGYKASLRAHLETIEPKNKKNAAYIKQTRPMFHICRVFTFFTDYSRNRLPGPDLSQLLTDHSRNKGLHWPGPLPLPLVNFYRYAHCMSS